MVCCSFVSYHQNQMSAHESLLAFIHSFILHSLHIPGAHPTSLHLAHAIFLSCTNKLEALSLVV